ncbi:MAG: head decoration protein [Marinobacterium sp.]|nr:head decoration protein [Marinobacterium sp.]
MPTESYDYEQWEVGSDSIRTATGTLASGQSLPARTPLGQVKSTGCFVAWAPAANDGSEVAVRMTALAVDTAAGDKDTPMITAGSFNSEQVNWPADATDAQKACAFVGTPISLQRPHR